ncbi:MAG: Gfo/Idh/MocA family protein [Chloroflexota bacterium]
MVNEPVRIGLLGAGFAAATHCQAYADCIRPPAQVVAVAARRRSSAEALAARFQIPAVVDDAEALLARDDLDAIDICTPNRSHAPLALAALRSGRHVLVEKPLTGYFGPDDAAPETRVGDVPRDVMLAAALQSADGLLQAAEQTGAQLAYGENLVYSPVVRRVKELLERSDARLLEIRASECHSGSHAAYARRWREAGGGALLRLGSHPIGLALHLKRAEGERLDGRSIEVAAVSAEVATLANDGGAGGYLVHGWEDVENWSAVMLTFTDGSHAICLASDLALGGVEDSLQLLTARARFNINLSHSSLLQVYAPSGDIFSGEPLQEKSHTNAGWSFPEVGAAWLYGVRDELQDFVAAIRANRPPLADGRLGRAVVEAIYAAYLSAAEGRRVTLRPVG